MAQPDYPPDKSQKVLLAFIQIPVEPGGLVVLAVDIIVAILSMAQFISCQDHRYTLRE